MAVGVDMFGAGGEGLGGLFVGNELAMQRDMREQEMAKAQADMARTAAATRGAEISNQYEEAILGDKVAAYKSDVANKKETADLDRFNRQGEQFGRLGQLLSGIPAAARPAAIRQMAAQGGIGEDNPMLQHMMNADPEALPDLMMTFSKGFYEQGDKARAEKMKRDEMMRLKEMEMGEKRAIAQEQIQGRKDIAQMMAESRRDAANIAASASRANAATRAAGKTGADGKPVKMSTDQAIAASIMNNPDMTPDEKLEALQRYQYNRQVMGKSGVEEQVMGAATPEQRVDRALSGGKTQPKAAAGMPTVTSAADYNALKPGTKYKDPQGNTRTKQ